MPVLEDGRVNVDLVADRALDGIAAAVDDRLDRLDLDPRRWLLGVRKGHLREILSGAGPKRMDARTLIRNPPSSDLAAERGAGRARIPLRRLARSRRAALVAGSAARAARGDHGVAVHVAVGVRRLARRCSPSRGRASRAPTPTRSARATPTGSTTGSHYGGIARGSGAVRARVAGASRATRPSAACGCSATSRSTSSHGGADHRRASAASSATARSPACRPTRSRETGQLWGNPLYDWSAMRADGYRWWIERLRRTFELVDLTRIDHFRGFVSYWAVPEREQDRGQGPVAARPRRRPLPRAAGRARRRCPSSPRTSA